jgi:hypothetical protein
MRYHSEQPTSMRSDGLPDHVSASVGQSDDAARE